MICITVLTHLIYLYEPRQKVEYFWCWACVVVVLSFFEPSLKSVVVCMGTTDPRFVFSSKKDQFGLLPVFMALNRFMRGVRSSS